MTLIASSNSRSIPPKRGHNKQAQAYASAQAAYALHVSGMPLSSGALKSIVHEDPAAIANVGIGWLLLSQPLTGFGIDAAPNIGE